MSDCTPYSLLNTSGAIYTGVPALYVHNHLTHIRLSHSNLRPHLKLSVCGDSCSLLLRAYALAAAKVNALDVSTVGNPLTATVNTVLPVATNEPPESMSHQQPPSGEGLVRADELAAAKINRLDPGTAASRLLNGRHRSLLQGVLQQEVCWLDVSMHGVGLMTHCNGLQRQVALVNQH